MATIDAPNHTPRRAVVDPWGTADLHTLELRAQLDALAYTAAELTERYDARDTSTEAAYARYVCDAARDALTAELARRERLYAAGHAVGDPHDRRYDQWLDLARDVRETADITLCLRGLGHDLRRTGTNSRRGTPEYHGPCPACGGTDRLVAWPPPTSRAWCRQCGISWDVIALIRAYVPGCAGWYAAVAYCAQQAGYPLPDDPYQRPALHRRIAVAVR